MNGKDCLLAFAELSDSQIAAASEPETIRRSFLQQKKRRNRIIETVCSCMIVVLMAVGFGTGNWFQRAPAVVSNQTENDKKQSGTSSSEVSAALSGVLPPETEPAQSASIQSNDPTRNRQTTSVPDKAPNQMTQVSEPTTATDSPSVDSTTKVPESFLEKAYVYSINDPAYSTYLFGKVIDPSKVGEKIGDATVTAGWKYADGTMSDTEQLRCEIFQINGIDPETAVCIKFIDKGEALTTDHYYIHYNVEADLSAVSDYVISAPVPNGEE